MKFIHVLVALVAAISQAQPIEEGNVPVLLPERDLTSTEPARLRKRADVTFVVYTSADCSTGGTTIYASGNGAKGDFSTAQHSVKVTQLNSAYHLSLYTARSQSGSLNLRLNSGNVNQCWTYSGGWLSYGLYDT
ncbi:hypothetical protein F5Y19DRAFT_477046 [Xylariaceae sp. FL1651]|nr:hypothetical protein F5Y19DRAFT_477046 [Xylariaceae sp. FL1651]